MGILHFAGLGKSAGAVTAGLSYVCHQYGRSHSEYGIMAETLIIFTSPEIATGREPAFAARHNEFGAKSVKKEWTAKHDKNGNAVEIVSEFMRKEFSETAVYLVTVDVNDFSACFDAVSKAVLRFHEPGKVGKHIWVNMTGGSNLLNAAMTQNSYLSGLIARMYYTFVADIRANGGYLQPFSKDRNQFRYGEIYAFKTQFDQRHQTILELLAQSPSRYWGSEELLSHLKANSSAEFVSITLQAFKRDFLNVMQGIERKGNRQAGQEDWVCISQEGQNILDIIKQPLFQALVSYVRLPEEEIEALNTNLVITRL